MPIPNPPPHQLTLKVIDPVLRFRGDSSIPVGELGGGSDQALETNKKRLHFEAPETVANFIDFEDTPAASPRPAKRVFRATEVPLDTVRAEEAVITSQDGATSHILIQCEGAVIPDSQNPGPCST